MADEIKIIEVFVDPDIQTVEISSPDEIAIIETDIGTPGADGSSVFNYRDIWVISDAYLINDVINYQGSGYVCIQDSTGDTPDSSPLFWQLLASKGDTGSQGVQGDPGIQGPPGNDAAPVTVTSPLVRTVNDIAIPASSSSVDGYLTSTSFNTFNNKEPAVTPTTSSDFYRGDKTFQNFNTAARAALSVLTPLLYSSGQISIQPANGSQSGYLSAADWNTFNNKLEASQFNYVDNPSAEVDASGWNLYNDAGRTDPAFYIDQDITWTAVASGNAGNGINISYVFHGSQSYTTPLVTVVSPTLITIAWYNGPTVANNPTATQLKAAFDAVPGAVALATCTISGTASDLQYINGSHVLANGGDTSPVDGTGGSLAGVTFTRTTSNPLIGVASFHLEKDTSDRMGSGVSTDFTINSVDKGNSIQVSFYYSGSSMVFGSSSDIRVFIYDITNSALIPTTIKTLTGPTADTTYRFAAQFTTSETSVNYRLILHFATSTLSASALHMDGVIINSVLDASAATQVPKLVAESQPITGSVTDHMAVMWQDGNTSWRPATMASGSDDTTLYGFAINIVGLTADIVLKGYLDGFSIGPFLGYNQYVDTTAGGISPLPSPFTDTGVTMGKGVATDAMLVNPKGFRRLVTSKGGLLSNAGANNGTGDQVLAVGSNGNVMIANSAQSLGLQWAPAVVASAPFTYTTSTRTLTIATSTDSVAGVMSAADHAILSGHTTTLALKAPLASPTFTGTPTLPTGTIAVTQAAADSSTKVATTAFVTTADNLKAPLASPTFTGDVNSSTGNVLVSTLGKGLQVKTGTNSKIGTAVLVAGTVTVANTSVTANSRIFLTSQTDGGTPGFLRVSAKTNATSFVITSSNAADTSTVAWVIIESIP